MVGNIRNAVFGIVGATMLVLSGCATIDGPTEPHDPYESFNRSMFSFNSKLDNVLLGPLSKGYVHVTPAPARTAVFNFFENLGYLTTVLNQFLQGKVERGLEDAGRFVINSTFGLGGLVDFASGIDMQRNQEDFGQTLAVWGMQPGPYLELPLLGPNSLRSLPGIPVDAASDLVTWVNSPLDYVMSGVELVDTRSHLDAAIKLRDKSALDPYVFQREAYLQRRRHLVYDGDPPLQARPSQKQ